MVFDGGSDSTSTNIICSGNGIGRNFRGPGRRFLLCFFCGFVVTFISSNSSSRRCKVTNLSQNISIAATDILTHGEAAFSVMCTAGGRTRDNRRHAQKDNREQCIICFEIFDPSQFCLFVSLGLSGSFSLGPLRIKISK